MRVMVGSIIVAAALAGPASAQTVQPAIVVSPATIAKGQKVNFTVSVQGDGQLGAGGCLAGCKKCKDCTPTEFRGQRVVSGQTIRFSLPIGLRAKGQAERNGGLRFHVPVEFTPDTGTPILVFTNPLVLKRQKTKAKPKA